MDGHDGCAPARAASSTERARAGRKAQAASAASTLLASASTISLMVGALVVAEPAAAAAPAGVVGGTGAPSRSPISVAPAAPMPAKPNAAPVAGEPSNPDALRAAIGSAGRVDWESVAREAERTGCGAGSTRAHCGALEMISRAPVAGERRVIARPRILDDPGMTPLMTQAANDMTLRDLFTASKAAQDALATSAMAREVVGGASRRPADPAGRRQQELDSAARDQGGAVSAAPGEKPRRGTVAAGDLTTPPPLAVPLDGSADGTADPRGTQRPQRALPVAERDDRPRAPARTQSTTPPARFALPSATAPIAVSSIEWDAPGRGTRALPRTQEASIGAPAAARPASRAAVKGIPDHEIVTPYPSVSPTSLSPSVSPTNSRPSVSPTSPNASLPARQQSAGGRDITAPAQAAPSVPAPPPPVVWDVPTRPAGIDKPEPAGADKPNLGDVAQAPVGAPVGLTPGRANVTPPAPPASPSAPAADLQSIELVVDRRAPLPAAGVRYDQVQWDSPKSDAGAQMAHTPNGSRLPAAPAGDTVDIATLPAPSPNNPAPNPSTAALPTSPTPSAPPASQAREFPPTSPPRATRPAATPPKAGQVSARPSPGTSSAETAPAAPKPAGVATTSAAIGLAGGRVQNGRYYVPANFMLPPPLLFQNAALAAETRAARRPAGLTDKQSPTGAPSPIQPAVATAPSAPPASQARAASPTSSSPSAWPTTQTPSAPPASQARALPPTSPSPSAVDVAPLPIATGDTPLAAVAPQAAQPFASPAQARPSSAGLTVAFAEGSAAVERRDELQELIDALPPAARLMIIGSAANAFDNAERAQRLAQARALIVRRELIELGVAADRISMADPRIGGDEALIVAQPRDGAQTGARPPG